MTPPSLVVVNDDPVQNELLAGGLRGAGYQVMAFLDAGLALAELGRGGAVDLFVIDLHMPGIDGWKLCRLLRSPEFERFNATPILVVSATYAGDDVAAITREIGANAFLEAPVALGRLLENVQELLAGRLPRSEQVVLIADGDANARRDLARGFACNGFVVSHAATAEQVGALARERRVDVAILDYDLPGGERCEDLVAEVRSQHPSACVLVMTGDAGPALPLQLLSSGVDAYLRKPFLPAFAVELARKASRERSLLRIETVLEARTRELRASEQRYRTLFDTIPDLVLVVDGEGRVVEVNPEGRRGLGGEGAWVDGARLIDRASPSRARELEAWLARVADGSGSGLETELLDGGGRTRHLELTGRAVEFRGSPALLVVGRDLTERRLAEAEKRQLEAQMQHAQRLESLGVLAGGVAHDFNNLLVGILGNASLAAMDLPTGSVVWDSVHQIEVAALRAAELTQQILAFAGKTAVTSEDISLVDLVREMGQLLEPAASKKARISYSLPPRLPLVRGDASQLRQVVMNLIINASDALRDRPGDIAVRVGLRVLGALDHLDVVGGIAPPPGPYVCLEVADQGHGMDEQTLRRIFEPFFTTKASGRGLGLAATLGIVRAHGGFVSVRSRPGEGTTMTVLLPPGPASVRNDAGPVAERLDRWSRGGRVLVVDDEPAVRSVAGAALKRSGFTVVEAVNGATGLEVALAPGATPDLVLLDLTMPEMDGIEALFALRKRFPRLPVLLSSGYPPQGVADSMRGPGPTAFLKKPYNAAQLLDATSRLLLLGLEEGRALTA